MKPCAIVAADFVCTGGMDRANFALASYLLQQGHEVHLVAHRIAPDLLMWPNAIPHLAPKIGNSYFLSEPFLNRLGRQWGARIAARGGHVITNGGNCLFGDLNWVHYVHAAYQPAMACGWTRRTYNRLKRNVYLAQERAGISRARLLFVNSERTRTDVVDRLKISEDRVRVVYYGIDPQVFRPARGDERATARLRLGLPPDRLLVSFVGALGDRRKGFDVLFNAWELLCRETAWHADLVVVGVGAELSAWRERATAAGMATRIHFLGFRKDVPEVLRACDALVAPTRYEAYGLGVHEALCCGLPAFVSADAGVAERYPAELQELLLPDANDANDLAQRLRDWHEMPDRFREPLQMLAQKLTRYSWNHMAADILSVMEARS